MKVAFTISILGLICLGLGLCMLLPMGVALIYGEPGWLAFLGGAFISGVLGLILYWSFNDKRPKELNHREGMAIVGLAWLISGFMGGVPLLLSGDFLTLADAVFESASGFTTTGASVLTNVEGAQKCVLFWRALTHWLGGMGFIVLGVAILPFLGVGGMQLYKAEVPSPTPDRLAPRITDTAKVLWKVYALLTFAEALLLLLGGMDVFDSVCHAFATMATGGFSTKNASVGFYANPFIQWVITVFMFLAGVNFTLHFQMFTQRDWKAMLRDDEWRFYAYTFAAFSLVIAASLWLWGDQHIEQSLRLAFFQVATIITTTGFATADYGLWPPLALSLLMVLMFVGGSAGSTGGGPKVLRIMILLRQSLREFSRLIHPRMVNPVKVGGRMVDKQIVAAIWSFVALYLFCFAATGVALAAMGLDVTTSFSASIACLGNIGPGLGDIVGPTGNYSSLPEAAKWLLSVVMIVGRLEIYTVLVLIIPGLWRD